MSDKNYKICPDCDGEGGLYLSCCGDEMNPDLDLCPTCLEHCGEGDFEGCDTCKGDGDIHLDEYEAIIEVRRKSIQRKSEKLVKENPGLSWNSDGSTLQDTINYSEAEKAVMKNYYERTGMLNLHTTKTSRVSSKQPGLEYYGDHMAQNYCNEILGNESLPFADLHTPKYVVMKNKGKDIFIDKSDDRNRKVQNFSIHKSRKLLDIQDKK